MAETKDMRIVCPTHLLTFSLSSAPTYLVTKAVHPIPKAVNIVIIVSMGELQLV